MYFFMAFYEKVARELTALNSTARCGTVLCCAVMPMDEASRVRNRQAGRQAGKRRSVDRLKIPLMTFAFEFSKKS
jgi:hypothetical protein